MDFFEKIEAPAQIVEFSSCVVDLGFCAATSPDAPDTACSGTALETCLAMGQEQV